jgi:hypothetical protein
MPKAPPPSTTADASAGVREVHFIGGATLAGPSYPDGCAWVAVRRYGAETCRVDASAVQAAPGAALERLADALSGGRPPIPELPSIAVDVTSADAGIESAVTAIPTGRTLRFASAGNPVSYIRVCEPDGAEVAFWDADELAQDAAGVLGDVLAAVASTHIAR